MGYPQLVSSPALASVLFPASVVTAETFTFPGPEVLFPAERDQVSKANAKRVADFAAGRQCARAALTQLGVAQGAVLSSADRLPLWPDGVVGSITHCAGYCGAAVARACSARSLGFDAEPNESLDSDLIDLVCAEGELEAISLQTDIERERAAKLVFSAKESVFKCQYPLTARYLEFADVAVSFDFAGGCFAATIAELGVSLEGRFLISQGLILTGCVADSTFGGRR